MLSYIDEDRDTEAVAAVEADHVLDPARARCRTGGGILTHLFFSDDLVDIARAKAICARCSQSAACLNLALEQAATFGVWGGQLFVNGHVIAQKRRRGRPPKLPRPELVIDELDRDYFREAVGARSA